MKKILEKEVELLPIMTPNFILTSDRDLPPIPLTDFSDDELRSLGNEFTQNLVDKANGRKK